MQLLNAPFHLNACQDLDTTAFCSHLSPYPFFPICPSTLPAWENKNLQAFGAIPALKNLTDCWSRYGKSFAKKRTRSFTSVSKELRKVVAVSSWMYISIVLALIHGPRLRITSASSVIVKAHVAPPALSEPRSSGLEDFVLLTGNPIANMRAFSLCRSV